MINKHIFFLLISAISFIVSSCSNNRDRDTIYIAEKLLENNPDSALVLLESLDFPEEMAEKDCAKYSQLLVVAHLNNKITIKEDTLILNAVNFYRERDQTEYIKSLLLLGNVLEERDSLIQAEKCYQEVFKLSEKLNDKELYGVSAFEIGGLLKHLEKYDQSIDWFSIASTTFKEIDNQRMKRRSMRQIADCHVLSGRTDTALVIYNEVLSQIPPQRLNVKADVYKNIAITYKNAKYYNESLQFIKKSIETTDTESLYPIKYLILASIYEETGKADSAIYYNKIALRYAKEQNDLEMINKVHEALIELNQPINFDNYALSKSASDSLYLKQKYESVKYQKLYNIEKIKKKNKELTIKTQQYVLLILLVIFISVILYLYQYNNKRKKQIQFEQELETKNNIINSIRSSLYQRLLIYKRMVQLSVSPNKDKHKAFLKEYNKLLFGKDDDFEFEIDWDIIYDFGNSVFDNFVEKIDSNYPEFNDTDRKMIILQKLGFNMTEIATILGKSIHTLYKYSSTIRKNLNVPENGSVVDFMDDKFKTVSFDK